MFNEEELSIYIESVMNSKDNVEIALNATRVYNDIRKAIILKFVSNLAIRLENCFNDKKSSEVWKIENKLNFTNQGFKQNCGLAVFKETWGGKYSINIEPAKNGALDFGYGINKIPEAKPIQLLTDELNSKCGPGEKNDFWCWVRPLDAPYRDWWDEALLKMYGDKAEALETFTNRICKLIELSEKYIDDAISDKD